VNSGNGQSSTPLHGTPDMGVDLWGESPLYENGNRLEDSIPNVDRLREVLGEGNRGEVTNRGKEACGCVR
jgi:hypothetical protein